MSYITKNILTEITSQKFNADILIQQIFSGISLSCVTSCDDGVNILLMFSSTLTTEQETQLSEIVLNHDPDNISQINTHKIYLNTNNITSKLIYSWNSATSSGLTVDSGYKSIAYYNYQGTKKFSVIKFSMVYKSDSTTTSGSFKIVDIENNKVICENNLTTGAGMILRDVYYGPFNNLTEEESIWEFQFKKSGTANIYIIGIKMYSDS